MNSTKDYDNDSTVIKIILINILKVFSFIAILCTFSVLLPFYVLFQFYCHSMYVSRYFLDRVRSGFAGLKTPPKSEEI